MTTSPFASLRPLDSPEGEILALLGPTNTGKTHRAVERMLQHPTGMIGLPLRLLAREVYDRITAEKGEQAVALVTGEEKRIPRDPRWWVCTVEAMPAERPVSFLAVDEIQLAGDRNRGHVFTDRLLRARGVRETMFLGSETIAPLLEELVPTARIHRHPRFSKLSHAGWKKLGALPRRTAIVAFSANDVYAVAEQVRRRHGGTAVVLGALSPRTRNAQVAMYQSGEVQYMVATDAIGMGLNMDVHHVAFTAVRKFDGRAWRNLHASEVAQIAGRAGRWKRDGTFGGTEDGEIPPDVAAAVEAHAFPPLKKLWWRNADLDFGSLDDLRQSLMAPPPRHFLHVAREEDDERVLGQLVAMPEVRDAVRGEAAVRLLWQVCGIPDFRKTLTDDHAQLLLRVWRHLAQSGRVPATWVERQIDTLDRLDGDIDLLSTRIAWIRTWTYISHRADWLEDAPALQARAREVEDRLSDALHAALTARFVDRRTLALATGVGGDVSPSGELRLGGYVAGTLQGIAWKPAADADRATERAAARALADELELRVGQIVDAPHGDFAVDEDGTIRWGGGPVARLVAGPSLVEPGVKLARNDMLTPSQTTRLQRRMSAFGRDFVNELLAPLRPRDVDRLGSVARGLLFELERGLGVVGPRRAADFDDRDRRLLAKLGVRFGTERCFALPLIARVPEKQALWAAWKGDERSAAYWEAMGTPLVGGVPVPADVLEEVAARARNAARRGPFEAFDAAIPPEDLPRVLEGLGYRRAGDRWVRAQSRTTRLSRGS